VLIHASVYANHSKGRERTQPRVDARDAVPHGRMQSPRPYGALKVHGECYYGAHRLPAGKTAAGKREPGRPASQAEKLFEGRLLQVSKASAPVCGDGRILGTP
jgi:hypothetical protein